MKSNFAENLARLRKRAGLNQDEMAEMSDVSVDTVRRWEGGKQEPRLGELVRIAKILGISVSQLIDDENKAETLTIRNYGSKKANANKRTDNNIIIQQGNTRVEIPPTSRGYDILEKTLNHVNLNSGSLVLDDLAITK